MSPEEQNRVVSYFNSTSNHNSFIIVNHIISVVSYFNSTSNHNELGYGCELGNVVSYFNSTSNHNSRRIVTYDD